MNTEFNTNSDPTVNCPADEELNALERQEWQIAELIVAEFIRRQENEENTKNGTEQQGGNIL